MQGSSDQPRRARLTWRKGKKIDQHLLFINGEQAATVSHMENRTGWYWAWAGFYRGRFGGPDNIEHPSLDAAKSAAMKWAKEVATQ